MRNTFKELLENCLMKTKLFEMAYNRQKCIDQISALKNTIADHFIEVLLFNDQQDYEHWCFELETHFQEINRLKPNNRKLKYDDYFNTLFDGTLGHEGALEDIVKSLYKLKRIPYIPKVDFEIYRNKLKFVYEELCDDLSIDNYDGIEKYINILKGVTNEQKN